MEIVAATKTQLAVVQQLAHEIWPKTYGGIISGAQIAYMLELMYSIPSLEKQLETRPFLLAEDQGQFIGFASYETHAEGTRKTKIHKLYVLPQTQGRGIGSKLLDHIASIALASQNTALYLTVNKNNSAREFYEKVGFKVTQEAVFDIGSGFVMDDYVMEKSL